MLWLQLCVWVKAVLCTRKCARPTWARGVGPCKPHNRTGLGVSLLHGCPNIVLDGSEIHRRDCWAALRTR